MPVLSRFWESSSPCIGTITSPHISNARYGEYEVIVHIATGEVEGRFPKRALRHVIEWYDLHQDELMANWERCRRREAPNPIDPLE